MTESKQSSRFPELLDSAATKFGDNDELVLCSTMKRFGLKWMLLILFCVACCLEHQTDILQRFLVVFHCIPVFLNVTDLHSNSLNDTYFYGSLALTWSFILLPAARSSQFLLSCIASQLLLILNPKDHKKSRAALIFLVLPFSLGCIISTQLNLGSLENQTHSPKGTHGIAFSILYPLLLLILCNYKELVLQQVKKSSTNLDVKDQEIILLKQENEDLKLSIKEQGEKISIDSQKLQNFGCKDTIASSISHEFRNPLNVILGNLDLLIMEVKDPKSLEMLESCRDSCETLLSLVNNILDAAKIHSGQLELNIQPNEILATIKNIWSTISENITKKGLFGQLSIDREVPLGLEVDKHRVKQICFNIISNAIKFTSKGFIKLHYSWLSIRKIHSMIEFDEELKRKLTEPSSEMMSLYKKGFSTTHITEKRGRILSQKDVFENSEDDSESEENFVESLSNLEDSPGKRKRALRCKSMSMVKEHSTKTWSFPSTLSKTGTTLCKSLLDHEKLEENKEDDSENPEGFLKIECLDSGCGISQEVYQKLFEQYQTGDDSIKRRFGGAGLGLYITNQLVTLMKGWIDIDTEVNTGTRICVIIPARRVETPSKSGVPPSLKKLSSGISSMMNILIVEDNPYNTEILTKFFQKLGLRSIYSAANGIEAAKLFKEKGSNFFTLITMDLQMPEMDGLTCCRAIREIEQKRDDNPTPIVIISGNCSKEEQDACLSEDGSIRAAFFYRKPVSFIDVESFVSKLLRPLALGSPHGLIRQQTIKKQAVLVDGDDFSREFLGNLLGRYDWEIFNVKNLEEASKLVKKSSNIECLLIDCDQLYLKTEGKDQISRLKQNKPRKDGGEEEKVWLVALSRNENSLYKENLIELGFDKVLSKPVRLNNLRQLFEIERVDFSSME